MVSNHIKFNLFEFAALVQTYTNARQELLQHMYNINKRLTGRIAAHVQTHTNT